MEGFYMEFKLHTYDIQRMMIAMIEVECASDEIISKNDTERILKKLCEINNMCNEGNDHAVNVKIE